MHAYIHTHTCIDKLHAGRSARRACMHVCMYASTCVCMYACMCVCHARANKWGGSADISICFVLFFCSWIGSFFRVFCLLLFAPKILSILRQNSGFYRELAYNLCAGLSVGIRAKNEPFFSSWTPAGHWQCKVAIFEPSMKSFAMFLRRLPSHQFSRLVLIKDTQKLLWNASSECSKLLGTSSSRTSLSIIWSAW